MSSLDIDLYLPPKIPHDLLKLLWRILYIQSYFFRFISTKGVAVIKILLVQPIDNLLSFPIVTFCALSSL